MSKEEYLKGEKKEVAFDLIRKYLAYRMTNEEILDNLKAKGFDVSERTLRRYKQEIRESSGKNLSEIFQCEVIDNAIEDIFTMRELQRQSWKEFTKSKSGPEKLKALNLIRNSILDKYKLYNIVPQKKRFTNATKKAYDIPTDSTGDEQKDLKN